MQVNRKRPKRKCKRVPEGKRSQEVNSLIQFCKREQRLPLIVFSFSREQCLEHARALSMETTLRQEERDTVQARVSEVLTNLVSPEDRLLECLREVTQRFLTRGMGDLGTYGGNFKADLGTYGGGFTKGSGDLPEKW